MEPKVGSSRWSDLRDAMRQSDYVQRIKFVEDFSNYWIGHLDGDVYAPRQKVNWVLVDGEYTVLYHRKKFKQKVNVAGNISFTPQ